MHILQWDDYCGGFLNYVGLQIYNVTVGLNNPSEISNAIFKLSIIQVSFYNIEKKEKYQLEYFHVFIKGPNILKNN